MNNFHNDDNKIKGDKVYEKFQQGISKIISELNLQDSKIEIEKYETEKIGIDYIATIHSKNTKVEFNVRTETKGQDLNKIDRGFLYIKINDDSRPYSYSDGKWFDYELPVSRWISEFFHKRNTEMQNRLEYIISNHRVRFIGNWGISTSSANLFEIMIKGALQNKLHSWTGKVPLLRIRHIDENELRLYSYIILLEGSAFVFPAFCGPDSGEGGAVFERVQSIIEKIKKDIILYNLDINYDKFKEFAVKHMPIGTFNSSFSITEYEKYAKIFKEYVDKNIFSFETEQEIDYIPTENIKERHTHNYFGPTIISTNSNINSGNKIKYNIFNKINNIRDIIFSSSYMDKSLKEQIFKKIDSFEKETENEKPNINKINKIKEWFGKIKNRIPSDIYNGVMELIKGFIMKQIGV